MTLIQFPFLICYTFVIFQTWNNMSDSMTKIYDNNNWNKINWYSTILLTHFLMHFILSSWCIFSLHWHFKCEFYPFQLTPVIDIPITQEFWCADILLSLWPQFLKSIWFDKCLMIKMTIEWIVIDKQYKTISYV